MPKEVLPYQLRHYTQGDFEFVYQAKKEAYQSYVEKFWGFWDEEKQRSLFIDFIQKVQNTLLIIEYNGTPIGLYQGGIINSTTYEIGNIIIIPQYQGQGIGKDILINMLQEHFKLKIRLQVFKGNPAIDLYKKLGFTVADENRTHLIMER